MEYLGTRYHGFQVQPIAPTVQGELNKALQKLTGERVKTTGAGRTDAGVHAKGQVVSFFTGSSYPARTFQSALNSYLPEYVRVLAASDAPPTFDARRSARSRTYEYLALTRAAKPALLRGLVYHFPYAVDVQAMREAGRLFLGRHDFASFSGSLDKEKGRSTVRRLMRVSVGKRNGLLVFTVEGDAFLPQQLRRIVGTLLDIGRGKSNVGRIKRLLEIPKLGISQTSVPPEGLYLTKVKYKGFTIG